MKSREYFKGALYDKRVPILVLDQKWHRLFAIHGKSEEIKQFEQEDKEKIDRVLPKQNMTQKEIENLIITCIEEHNQKIKKQKIIEER